jgi:hypothetical protein
MSRPPRDRKAPPSGRRKPPQTDTGDEHRFFQGHLTTGDRLTIELIDGTRAVGVIRKHTADTIEIQTDERPGWQLHKSQIRSIEES